MFLLEDEIFYIKFKKLQKNYYNALEILANNFSKGSFPDKGSIYKNQLHFNTLAAVELKMQ